MLITILSYSTPSLTKQASNETFPKNVILNQDLSVRGSEWVAGTLNVRQATNTGDLTVAGDVTITGDATIDGDIDIAGSITLSSATVTNLTVTNDATIDTAEVTGTLSYANGLGTTLYPIGTSSTSTYGLKSAYALFNAGLTPSPANNYVTNGITSITHNSTGNYTINYTAAGFQTTTQPIILTTVAQFSTSALTNNTVTVMATNINHTTCTIWTMLNGAPSNVDINGDNINFSFLALGA